MRKVKVGFISPYEAMMPLIDELAVEQDDLQITRAVGNLEAGVALALEMERNGADVLISRGGTAKLIREAVSLPVVEIHISGYDLLRSIMLAEGHSNELKALIGFPNITMGAASIVSLLELRMEVVELSSAAEVVSVLKHLKERGVRQVLGDVVTIDAAAKLGLNGLLIQSGRETLLEAFEEARRLFLYAEKNQQQLRALELLLDGWHKDVVILDDDGELLFERYTAFPRQPISSKELLELRKQLSSSPASSFVKLYVDSEAAFYVKGEVLEDRSGLFTAWSFEQVSFNNQNDAFTIAQPAQLPLIVSESPGMKTVRQLVESEDATRQPVLIIGEKSTGKQTLAEYIHVFQNRSGLLLTVDMDKFEQLPAFHVPEQSTIVLSYGKSADQETIKQTEKWLRVLGRDDVHFIALLPAYDEHVADALGKAIQVQAPALRERQEDIPYLVNQFLTEYHQQLGTQPVRLREEAMAVLSKHNWPGNLEEMKSYVKKIALAEKSYVIEKQTIASLPFEQPSSGDEPLFYLDPRHDLKEIERYIIEQVLKEENYNQTQAAKRLGINRATLWRKLKD
ncbi:PrpR N-terminal domain-containing protein [Planococcus maritimus]|nr:sigma-54-dependent transcriptional regulator [Planococcus sp. SK3692]MDE4085913.1 PrpR N-terminal domain-containing protein [Planococcus maritimus]